MIASRSPEKTKIYRDSFDKKYPNRKKLLDAQRYLRLKKEQPWYLVFLATKKRCKYDEDYKKLENDLTLEQVKTLWFRDKADKLRRPSIDRIKNNLGYHFWNCQFIELGINSVKDKTRKEKYGNRI